VNELPRDLSAIRACVPVDARLCTSGQPNEAQIAAIAAAGYVTLINLALHDDPRYSLADEAGTALAAGLRYIHIPVRFEGPTANDLQRFFDAMDACRDEKTWVHCAANVRVSIFIGLYRVLRLGWDEHTAFDLQRANGFQLNEVWRTFIDELLASTRA
jgi:uncharacterized protein (TIGR01244 family)